jgi:hypothetical protein
MRSFCYNQQERRRFPNKLKILQASKVVYTIELSQERTNALEHCRNLPNSALCFNCKSPAAQADQQHTANYCLSLLSRAWGNEC